MDELVNKLFAENYKVLQTHIANSKYPLTFETLLNFNSKFIALNKSLELIKDCDTFYISQGLTRIMLEHYLVAFYIWTRCRTDLNDNCAYDYHYHYLIYEHIKQTNFNSKLDKTYDSKVSPLENYLIKFPNQRGRIDEECIKELNSKSNKFDIRNILKFMKEELNELDFYSPQKDLVHSACQAYNTLSSYVHGGRYAEYKTFENQADTEKLKTIEENINFSKGFVREVKSWIFMLAILEDRTFIKIYQPVIDLLRTII